MKEPFLILKADPTIWIIQKTGIVDDLIKQPYATILDLYIFALAIFCFYQIYKGKKAILSIALFCLSFFFYFAISQSFPNLSPRKYLGLLIIPFTLLFLGQRFRNYTELIRYFILFIFFSASIWKLYRGILLVPDQMVHILQGQHIQNFFLLEGKIVPNQVAKWVILHPTVARILLYLGILLQLSFGFGFFTKRYDKLLFALMVAFITADHLLMGIEYWEFLVFTPYFFIPEIEKRYGLS